MASLNGRIEREIVPDFDPDPSYLEQEGFEDRLAQYQRDEFGYVGVRAVATIDVCGVLTLIKSPGIWGVEDDSGDEYLAELFEGEKAELERMLADLGVRASVERDTLAIPPTHGDRRVN